MTPCIMQLASQRVIQLLVNPWVLQLLFRIIMTRYDKCLQEFAYAGCGFAVCARDCYDLLSDKQHMQNTHEYSVYLSLFSRIAHLALDKVFKWSPKMTKHDHIFFVRFHGSMVSVSCGTPLRAVCHLHHRVNHASRPLCRGTEFGGDRWNSALGGEEWSCQWFCMKNAWKPLRSTLSVALHGWAVFESTTCPVRPVTCWLGSCS